MRAALTLLVTLEILEKLLVKYSIPAYYLVIFIPHGWITDGPLGYTELGRTKETSLWTSRKNVLGSEQSYSTGKTAFL